MPQYQRFVARRYNPPSRTVSAGGGIVLTSYTWTTGQLFVPQIIKLPQAALNVVTGITIRYRSTYDNSTLTVTFENSDTVSSRTVTLAEINSEMLNFSGGLQGGSHEYYIDYVDFYLKNSAASSQTHDANEFVIIGLEWYSDEAYVTWTVFRAHEHLGTDPNNDGQPIGDRS